MRKTNLSIVMSVLGSIKSAKKAAAARANGAKGGRPKKKVVDKPNG